MEEFDRAMMKAENHAMLMRFLGAVLGVKIIRKWSLWPVLYWSQIDAVVALVYRAIWETPLNREITPWKGQTTYG